ncbi:MAG: Hsp20/alpha crystallin family protein [Candidatus Tumulicola sp.]
MEFLLRGRLGAFEPNADVFVDDDGRQVVAVVDVAGADPESLRVGFDEQYLYVRGRRREAVRLRHGSFVQKEIASGDFARRIALPVAVEYEGAAADYIDGLLIVALPIAVTAYRRPSRTELHILVKRTHV